MALSITAGISAAKTGLDLLRGVRELLKQDSVDRNEISNRLSELQELLSDAKTSLSDAQDENREIQSRVNELERLWDFGKDLQPKHGVYWKDKYPYCPSCWEANRQPIRLSGPEPGRFRVQDNNWICPIHKATYTVPLKGFDAEARNP